MKPTIIIPVCNEAKYLGKFLDKLLLAVSKERVVVVNDGSTDKTKEIAGGRGVIVLSHMTNLGKGAGMKTGCDYAFKKMGAESVIIMDGDDQHEVSDLSKFESALGKGAQVVLGVRNLDAKMPAIKLLGNRFASILINILFGAYLADIPSGFKGFTKSAYKTLQWYSSGYEVETELAVRIAKTKTPFVEVPISTIYNGKDNGFNLLDAWGILIKIPYWIWS
jgi:glycosyltransferase involved in cell wall biosynthesis